MIEFLWVLVIFLFLLVYFTRRHLKILDAQLAHFIELITIARDLEERNTGEINKQEPLDMELREIKERMKI